MPTGFHSNPHLFPAHLEFAVEVLCFLAVPQFPLVQFTCVCIYKRHLLEARVIVTTYNDHLSAPFSRALVWLAPPKFTRAWEPTLLWNHYTHSPALRDEFHSPGGLLSSLFVSAKLTANCLPPGTAILILNSRDKHFAGAASGAIRREPAGEPFSSRPAGARVRAGRRDRRPPARLFHRSSPGRSAPALPSQLHPGT